ncbi:hypothetical protein [Agromyces indicus]|uniref:Uncharacterized protein n=1 Tax=Agromyces indicus TaxID=758919 RepID=A0ABU1FMA4_9MICO|nr:hypothetical protein [Agromyces indicus]MDR5692908.1 hypothetical protein [Agromyces indicus]
MRSRTIILAATGLAIVGSVGLAAPASAIEAGPSSNASCVGQIFVPQATGDPGAIAMRIAEIRGFAGTGFGPAIAGLASQCDVG